MSHKVSLLCTDQFSGYRNLFCHFSQHEEIHHDRNQYVVGAIHTNTIEGFWSIFKRGVVGTFHKVSRKCLPLYVAEFQFRYNNRENENIFAGDPGLLMNRYRRMRIALAALIVFFVAVLGASLFAPSYKHCEESYQAQPRDPDKQITQPHAERTIWELPWVWLTCEGEFVDKNGVVLTTLFTIILAGSTILLWLATSNIVESAEATAAEQLRYTRQINRAYFAGGGECERDSNGPILNKDGHRQFRFEVGNHGKTVAFMEAYDIQFATMDEVCRRRIPFDPGTFVDQFPPGETSRPTDALIPITRSDADVAFGIVLYKDIWGTDHYSRFILKIAKNGQTHSNVPGIDSKYYRAWT